MTMQKQCPQCKKIIKGRADKKFCSKSCSNLFHYEKRKIILPKEVKHINNILLKNRKILASIFENKKQNKIMISKLKLTQLGFNFDHITGFYINRKQKMYKYIYHFAWMEFSNQDVMLIRKSKT